MDSEVWKVEVALNSSSPSQGVLAWAVTWDYENRLAPVTVGRVTTRFTYDSNEALVQKDDGLGFALHVGGVYEMYEMPSESLGISDDGCRPSSSGDG